MLKQDIASTYKLRATTTTYTTTTPVGPATKQSVYIGDNS
jgi:hypothetical protein